jgi:hypothetical protein
MGRIEARRKNASALRLRFSQYLESLQQRWSQATVPSTNGCTMAQHLPICSEIYVPLCHLRDDRAIIAPRAIAVAQPRALCTGNRAEDSGPALRARAGAAAIIIRGARLRDAQAKGNRRAMPTPRAASRPH